MRPMLAATANLISLVYPLFASPKYDGVRCIVKDGAAMSRSWKRLPNDFIQCKMRDEARTLENLDGELIVGDAAADDVFSVTTSGVMSKGGEPRFKFFVFDDITEPDAAYEERYDRLQSLGLPDWCKIVEHALVESREDALRYEQHIVERGYEGIILRDPDAAYKFGRSTVQEQGLLKMKRFLDSEAVIVGVQELLHNAGAAFTDHQGYTKRTSHGANKTGTGTLGAFLVRDAATGAEFSIGMGFDDAQRRAFWEKCDNLMGRLVKYKYMPHGMIAAPRHPVFLGFRDPMDV